MRKSSNMLMQVAVEREDNIVACYVKREIYSKEECDSVVNIVFEDTFKEYSISKLSNFIVQYIMEHSHEWSSEQDIFRFVFPNYNNILITVEFLGVNLTDYTYIKVKDSIANLLSFSNHETIQKRYKELYDYTLYKEILKNCVEKQIGMPKKNEKVLTWFGMNEPVA